MEKSWTKLHFIDKKGTRKNQIIKIIKKKILYFTYHVTEPFYAYKH